MGRHVRLMPLVGVLIWAVAFMHSLPGRAGGEAPAAGMVTVHVGCCQTPSVVGELWSGGVGGDEMPGHGSHDVASLCLAVLTALIAGGLGVGISLSLRARSAGAAGRGRPGERSAVARPPPKAGRALLTSVCVLRV